VSAPSDGIEAWAWSFLHASSLEEKLNPGPAPAEFCSWRGPAGLKESLRPARPPELQVLKKAPKTPRPGADENFISTLKQEMDMMQAAYKEQIAGIREQIISERKADNIQINLLQQQVDIKKLYKFWQLTRLAIVKEKNYYP